MIVEASNSRNPTPAAEMRFRGEPGPFDDDQYRTVPPLKGIEERRRRLLWLIAEHKGVAGPHQLSMRCKKAVDLRLFDLPPVHRAARKRVFAAVDILEEASHDKPGAHRGISDYAHIEFSDKGTALVRLTSLGTAVRYALYDVFPPGGTRPGLEFADARRAQRQEAFKIFNAHPDCPWPIAELVISHAKVLGQGAWHAPLWHPAMGDPHVPFIYPDCDAEFIRGVGVNAKNLLPDVMKVVAMFEHLYDSVECYASPLFSPDDDSTDFDVDTWPRLLYWGGKVAVNAGRHEYGVALLKRLVTGMSDSTAAHWAREPLSALILDEGPSAVSACFPRERFRRPTAWECMAMAASNSLASRRRAAEYYCEAMVRSVTAMEVFNDGAPKLPTPKAFTPDAAPDCMRQSMYLSATFWERHPNSAKFFHDVAQNPKVQSAVLTWHRKVREEGIVAYWDPRLEGALDAIRKAVRHAAK